MWYIWFNIFKKNNLLKFLVKGLELIQHRGQDSCGISFYENDKIKIIKNNGLVKNVFDKIKLNQKTNCCIGHVRYTTSGSKNTNLEYIQPIKNLYLNKDFSISFNGNIPLIKTLYNDLEVDTIGIIKFLLNPDNSFEQNIKNFMNTFHGVYCILILYEHNIYVLRDRYGTRPLYLGTRNDIICISSETIGITDNNFYILREVQKGEILKLKNNEIFTIYKHKNSIEQKCLFEYIYFLKSYSYFSNIVATEFREMCGKELALNDIDFINSNFDDIIVVGCPNSGICSGVSYAEKFKLKYKQVIKKNKNKKNIYFKNTRRKN